MNKSEILIELEIIFKHVFKRQDLILNEELKGSDVAEWDSLSHLILIGEIESHFKIKFKLKELINMQCVGDMLEVIFVKLN
jgi:acyl carrier protein